MIDCNVHSVAELNVFLRMFVPINEATTENKPCVAGRIHIGDSVPYFSPLDFRGFSMERVAKHVGALKRGLQHHARLRMKS